MKAKRFAAAILLALTLAVGGVQAQNPPNGYTQVWGCAEYFFGFFQSWTIVYANEDPSHNNFGGWPYTMYCMYLGTCDTWFDQSNGTYVTYCN